MSAKHRQDSEPTMTPLADTDSPPSAKGRRRPGRRELGRTLLVGIALVLALVPQEVLAQKPDVVALTNGDRLTGEVKTLYSGRLEYKTDPAKTIQIRWDYVVKLTSVKMGSWAQLGGLRAGHVVLAVNGQKINSVQDLGKAMQEAESKQTASIVFFVKRKTGTAFAEVRPDWSRR